MAQFLQLPAELRSQINEEVLGGLQLRLMIGMNTNLCLIESRPAAPQQKCETWRHPKHLLALTIVCRQLRAETRLLPFALNDFYGSSRNFLNAKDGGHINAEQLSAMRNIELSLDIDDFVRTRIPGTKRANVSLGADLTAILGVMREVRDLRQLVVVWEGIQPDGAWKSLSWSLKNRFEQG